MVAASDRIAIAFGLSAGQDHDAPAGRKLLNDADICKTLCVERMPENQTKICFLMDRTYEDNATRELVAAKGFTPVVPPKSSRKEPWEYDRKIYKKRNEVERLFRRLKGFRRIFTRYEKLDIMFIAFILFALITDALK
jgi:transposase